MRRLHSCPRGAGFQDEYAMRHPRGLNPIQLNDIIFALHASFAVLVTIIQCFIYERGDQKVSWPARVFIIVVLTTLIVTASLSVGGIMHWLDFLYTCSYIKLTITLIKYVPQVRFRSCYLCAPNNYSTHLYAPNHYSIRRALRFS